jgi:hypothetical protein
MKRLGIFIALGLASIKIASAQSLDIVEGAAELSLSDITFPNNPAGIVSFSECEACESKQIPLDPEATFVGISGPVSLDAFLADVAELRTTEAGRDTFVSLFYNLTTNRVTRIRLHPDAS